MGINITVVNSQANDINNYISTLKDIRNSLNSFKWSLNVSWQAQEMIHVNIAIDNIDKEINKLAANLHSLRQDIIKTAYEIKQEEEDREAAASAARAYASASPKV